MAGQFFFRQTRRQPKHVDAFDYLTISFGILILNLWRFPPDSAEDLGKTIAVTLISAFIAVMGALFAQRMSVRDFTGTIWQRLLILQIAVSVPLLGSMNNVSYYHGLSAGLLLTLFLLNDSNKLRFTTGLAFGAIVLVMTPIVYPPGIIVTIWLCLMIITKDRENRFYEGLLLTGGAIILFLVGFLIAGIRLKGVFPATDMLYRLPVGLEWLAPLLDRSYGLVPAAPWFLIVLAGWTGSFTVKRTGFIQWLGFPAVLIGLTGGEWIRSGHPPDWSQWLLILPVLVPYYGAVWSKSLNAWTYSIVRVTNLLALIVSAILYIHTVVHQSGNLALENLLSAFGRNTGIEALSLLPAVSHLLPGNSLPQVVWLSIITVFIVILLLSRRLPVTRERRENAYVFDAIILSLCVGIAALGLKSVQVWYSVPIVADIHIVPGQSWVCDTLPDQSVTAMKLMTSLSRSTYIRQGHPVADVHFRLASGKSLRRQVQAGIHTAEWAYNRPDVFRSIQHSRPPVAWGWSVHEPDGSTFEGMSYESVIFLEKPEEIASVEIVNTEQDQNGCVLSIKSAGFMVKNHAEKWGSPEKLIHGDPIHLSTKANSHTFNLAGDGTYNRIYLDSTLINAAAVENGVAIGHVRIKSHDGVEKLWLVKAGIDTGEWSLDRPDMIGRVLHNKPKRAVSERRLYRGSPYLAHIFRSSWNWHPGLQVTEIIIRMDAPANASSDIEWAIHNIVLR